MRGIAVIGVVLAALALSAPQSRSARVPVVVELFTSEGCSSCPPADVLLSQLAAQPMAGVEIVPLGFHVTYWDQLGWKDSASLPLATDRQRDYSLVFGEDRVYTPQAVVDGREELIGSADAGVRQAIAKAAQQPHAQLTITAAADGETLDGTVTVDSIPPAIKEKLQVRMLITEDGLTSIVKRGENGGRTLRHDAVVRAMLGSDVADTGELTFHTRLRSEWRRERLHAVALLQGKSSRRIWGAASTTLK